MGCNVEPVIHIGPAMKCKVFKVNGEGMDRTYLRSLTLAKFQCPDELQCCNKFDTVMKIKLGHGMMVCGSGMSLHHY
jgi:hypothetical protein